jgi:hypothetical protein
MADRMTKDGIRKGCEGRPLELRELVDIIKEKDQWMRKAIMGRSIPEPHAQIGSEL